MIKAYNLTAPASWQQLLPLRLATELEHARRGALAKAGDLRDNPPSPDWQELRRGAARAVGRRVPRVAAVRLGRLRAGSLRHGRARVPRHHGVALRRHLLVRRRRGCDAERGGGPCRKQEDDLHWMARRQLRRGREVKGRVRRFVYCVGIQLWLVYAVFCTLERSSHRFRCNPTTQFTQKSLAAALQGSSTRRRSNATQQPSPDGTLQ